MRPFARAWVGNFESFWAVVLLVFQLSLHYGLPGSGVCFQSEAVSQIRVEYHRDSWGQHAEQQPSRSMGLKPLCYKDTAVVLVILFLPQTGATGSTLTATLKLSQLRTDC
uniref:Secreted protein n=1 Tax=Anabas testudineus TaxID=64144 RepID=A0AAQ6ID22_ANATE